MSTTLAALKRTFGFTDEVSVEYEENEGELIIRLGIVYPHNDEIIHRASRLAKQRESKGWTREEFFKDFLEVRDEVLNTIRNHDEPM